MLLCGGLPRNLIFFLAISLSSPLNCTQGRLFSGSRHTKDGEVANVVAEEIGGGGEHAPVLALGQDNVLAVGLGTLDQAVKEKLGRQLRDLLLCIGSVERMGG